ncbi:MAG TPA: ABC transporter ATP-binding protein [Actinomycetes bacterium]|jgi:ABC-2 type transport system ATP-binding protein|nr:ABC transporter ATP-binding protein [Actinomycetes bacterium]
MNEPVVVTDELSKRYGARAAVDAVSLTVHRGEIYGFLGPNGAGKTTTLRMLVGLVRPTRGSAQVLGGRPGDPWVLRRVGALIEGPGFYPYLSGRDNLRVFASYNRLPGADVERALEQVDLSARAGDKFKSYSLGMKQRLGVATALLGEPDLLILDEPTNGLDPSGMADMRALVRRLADQGRTVLLSSHLLGEVQQICDRVGVIAAGRLLTESTVAEFRGGSSLLVRAEPVTRAEQVIQSILSATDVRRTEDGGLHVLTGSGRSPEIVQALVRAGVEVHEIRPVERTLEEAFFDMTEHRQPVATHALREEAGR